MASSSTDLMPESPSSLEQEAFGGLRPVGSVILCGASVRSLAESVFAAGIQPLCVDFFEDEDLLLFLRHGRGRFLGRIDDFRELPKVTASVSCDIPLLWAGGLENYTAVVREIARQRPVIGTPPDLVDQLRNPFQLKDWLCHAGLQMPRIATDSSADPNLIWLRKPVRGSGGLGIQSFSPLPRPAPAPNLSDSLTEPSAGLQHAVLQPAVHPDEHYLQEYIDGTPMSAVFCSDSHRATLVGTSLQLAGWPCLGASDFRFCGNVGPVDPGETVTTRLSKAAQTLVDEVGLCGMFGIDFVLRTGTPWFLEVNPRFTASHMIYEPPCNSSFQKGHLVTKHLAAFGWCPALQFPRDSSSSIPIRHAAVQARLILWASDDFSFPEHSDVSTVLGGTTITLADLPKAATAVSAGTPICSVRVSAPSWDSLLQTLKLPGSSLASRLPCSWPEVCRQLTLLHDRFQKDCLAVGRTDQPSF